MSWRALKNGDAVRAALLREVADRLDCEIVLALADVHETWSCEDDWEDYGRRRHSCYSRDEAEGDDGGNKRAEAYELIELCDSDVELRHWRPSDKRVQPISGEVIDDEICFTKPSVDLEPFKSEHEGYPRERPADSSETRDRLTGIPRRFQTLPGGHLPARL